MAEVARESDVHERPNNLVTEFITIDLTKYSNRNRQYLDGKLMKIAMSSQDVGDDNYYQEVETIGSMWENDYPTLVDWLTPVHSDLERTSEGVSDNQGHTRYYHNLDIALYPPSDSDAYPYHCEYQATRSRSSRHRK